MDTLTSDRKNESTPRTRFFVFGTGTFLPLARSQKSQANTNHTRPIQFWDGLDLSQRNPNKEVALCVAQDPGRNSAMSLGISRQEIMVDSPVH